MTILNDTVTFTTADFAGLSDFAKKALTSYIEDYAKHFSSRVNRDIVSAKEYLKDRAKSEPVTDSIITGLAAAGAAKRLEAEPLLVQLNTLLTP